MLSNLRWCTSSENNKNTNMRIDTTSGCKGIVKCATVWKAQWYENDHKQHPMNFSIKTFGDEQAKTLAIDCRKAKEREFGYV